MTVEMTHRPTFHVVPRSAKSALLLSDLGKRDTGVQARSNIRGFADCKQDRIGQDFVL